MGRLYVDSNTPKEVRAASEVVEEDRTISGRVYVAPNTRAEVSAAKKSAKVGADVAEGEAVETGRVVDTVLQDTPANTEVEVPAGNASREEWVAYARTQHASDADLVDEDGKDLTRDDIRAKYGPADDTVDTADELPEGESEPDPATTTPRTTSRTTARHNAPPPSSTKKK